MTYQATPGDGQATRTVAEKSMLMLEALGSLGRPAGVSDLARLTGLPKTTAYRLLGGLVRGGFVCRAAAGYQLSERLNALAAVLRDTGSARLRHCLLPYVLDAYELTHETVHLMILRDHQVLILERLHGSRSTVVAGAVGHRWPAHCVAGGKVLLAGKPGSVHRVVSGAVLARRTPATITSSGTLAGQLEQVRRRGIGFDAGECLAGVVSVAVPMVVSGRLVAALSVMGAMSALDPARVAGGLAQIARAAATALRDTPVALATDVA